MEWLTELSKIGLPTIIAVIIGIVGFIKGLESFCKWIKGKFLFLYNRKRKNDKLVQNVDRHEKDITEIKESQNALSNGMQILLKENLKKLHKEYMDRGHITSDEFDDYNFQYNTYHSLGGNGTGTKYFNEVSDLEIID
jgi:hypothetical protein